MNEIEGPYEDDDGQYWTYRGWILRQYPCKEAQRVLGLDGLQCTCPNTPHWIAEPSHEMTQEEFGAIWARGNRLMAFDSPTLGRHVELSYSSDRNIPTIKDAIDHFEAEVERQFRANMEAALRGEA